MNLEKIANGEISIERFYGQTVIYFPANMVNKISRYIAESILLEFFSEEKLKDFHTFYERELKGVRFYSIEFPSVITENKQDYGIPDEIAKRIIEESSK